MHIRTTTTTTICIEYITVTRIDVTGSAVVGGFGQSIATECQSAKATLAIKLFDTIEQLYQSRCKSKHWYSTDNANHY
jgi:hypothetical protein